jgi:Holliday junction resolvase RusA-like endonuclease
MNDTITLTVLGNPKALKRHRMFRRGSKIGSYDPSAGDKADFLAVAHSQAPEKPLEGPIKVNCDFIFPRPKSHYRTGKYAGQLKPNAPTWHCCKPDRDNLDKFVLDALQGVFFRDDAQVVTGEIRKFYDERPRTVIKIDELSTEAGGVALQEAVQADAQD